MGGVGVLGQMCGDATKQETLDGLLKMMKGSNFTEVCQQTNTTDVMIK